MLHLLHNYHKKAPKYSQLSFTEKEIETVHSIHASVHAAVKLRQSCVLHLHILLHLGEG